MRNPSPSSRPETSSVTKLQRQQRPGVPATALSITLLVIVVALISVIAMLALLVSCSEQPTTPVVPRGSVNGRVFFEDTDRTIPKVKVSIGEQEYKTVTNGKFEFNALPYGSYSITAEKGGYVSYFGEVVVDTANVEHNIDLWYEPEE